MAPIAGSVQVVVPQPLWNRALYHSHYSAVESSLAQQRMYDFMQSELYWPHTACDVYTTVSSCSAYARSRTEPSLSRQVQLDLTSSPLKFIVIDSLTPLPATPYCRG